jgi:hypothetical protein
MLDSGKLADLKLLEVITLLVCYVLWLTRDPFVFPALTLTYLVCSFAAPGRTRHRGFLRPSPEENRRAPDCGVPLPIGRSTFRCRFRYPRAATPNDCSRSRNVDFHKADVGSRLCVVRQLQTAFSHVELVPSLEAKTCLFAHVKSKHLDVTLFIVLPRSLYFSFVETKLLTRKVLNFLFLPIGIIAV